MALRLIEAMLDAEGARQAGQLLAEKETLGLWLWDTGQGPVLLRVLLAAEQTEAVLNLLEEKFGAQAGFNTVLLPVEAVLPRQKQPEPEPDSKDQQVRFGRVSREELYQQSLDAVRLSWVFVALMLLSSLVAAIGLINNDLAVIIGAMVIAPMLGANSALSLATTLADRNLAWAALKVLVVGTLLGGALTLGLGLVLEVAPLGAQLLARTHAGLSNVVLALAAGAAGALAFTQGISAALVGVMVAVALVPPLATAGLMLGAGHWAQAGGAALLYLINLICINLAGVVAFRVQGIRPATWWEEKLSRRSTVLALALWFVLLAVLIAVLVTAGERA